jgi:hypothetical protein
VDILSTVITAIVAIFASLLGAWVGGRFALQAVMRSHNLQQQTKREQDAAFAERIRTMLSVEINDNVKALDKFDAGIDYQLVFSDNPVRKGMTRPEVLGITQLPSWKHEYWRALTASIPLALSPDEIRKCHEHHTMLDELTTIKGTSRSAASSTWHNAIEQTLSKLKEIGNPLRQSLQK